MLNKICSMWEDALSTIDYTIVGKIIVYLNIIESYVIMLMESFPVEWVADFCSFILIYKSIDLILIFLVLGIKWFQKELWV